MKLNINEVKKITNELQQFTSLRVNNIYDIDNKTFLLKFDDFENKRKSFIIIHSGCVVFNIYNPPQERRKIPTSFCMKMRKHIKNKRCFSIENIKEDRVIEMKFGSEEHQYKLIIELFSLGNIVLTDYKSIILAHLRSHVYKCGASILVNKEYPYEKLNDEEQENNNHKIQLEKKEPISLTSHLNTLYKFNQNKQTKIKKKKLTPIESIKKHSKDKMELLMTKIIITEKKIGDIYENESEIHSYKELNLLFGLIKKTKEKIVKMKSGTEKAIKKLTDIENKKIKQQRNKQHNQLKKEKLIKNRWFQQYRWFYTSNNHLVICGKNSTQNEEIVKKHMTSNDIYMHSTVSGCGSTIIKKSNDKDITPSDLEQSASFLICFSNAWKDKTPDSVFWVKSEQVSKTPPTGEYIQKGSFIIRGERNFIYRTELQLGCCIYDNMFMIAPYKRTSLNKIKISVGNDKRKRSVDKIIKKLNIDRCDYDVIDSIVPYHIKVIF
tara:strand:+ start:44 stop:1522 length:1479 start_codon:yes stop_codon:yes gene_type:complete